MMLTSTGLGVLWAVTAAGMLRSAGATVVVINGDTTAQQLDQMRLQVRDRLDVKYVIF